MPDPTFLFSIKTSAPLVLPMSENTQEFSKPSPFLSENGIGWYIEILQGPNFSFEHHFIQSNISASVKKEVK